MPGGVCACPHYGYIVEGTIRAVYPNTGAPDEVAIGGEVYFFPAGHVLIYEEATKVLELNPAFACSSAWTPSNERPNRSSPEKVRHRDELLCDQVAPSGSFRAVPAVFFVSDVRHFEGIGLDRVARLRPSLALRLASSTLLAGWRPVWFGGRCSPAKGRGVVDQNPGSASNHRPGVICAVK
jgi:hypothetical protein